MLISTEHSAIIPIDTNFASSLDGIWRFRLELLDKENRPYKRTLPEPTDPPFEPFYDPGFEEGPDWHDFTVPGNWEMAGYSPATYFNPDNAIGQFRRTFTVPVSWKGRRVLINFDGVQQAATIWVNGQPVKVTEPAWGRENYHEGSWNAWQADITSAVKFGGNNLVAIRAAKNSKSATLDSGDYYCLGGIYRPVTLFSVPMTHISDVTITTHLLDGHKAEVKVIVDVQGSDAASATVALEGQKEITADVIDGRAELSQIVSKPKLWSAEFPNLYNLEISLKSAAGAATETVTRRVGIREVTIENGILLVNGQIVKLAGICRHDLSADEGTAVGPELWRKDLELMRAANINSVRTSHYPYGAGFYDLCDEMGFCVIDELPYCWCPTDTDELTPAFASRARETVRRDKNHPCIIIWGVGNENKPGKNLRVAADIVKEMDPTRPRLVSEKPADLYGVELDDSHYVPPSAIAAAQKDRARRRKWPKIYTENPNVWDIRLGADYGCLDLWGEVIKRTWDVVWKSDGIPGTYPWEWQDRAVADKCPEKRHQWDEATATNYMKIKGIVDSRRNVRPDHYQLKMAAAQIQVKSKIDLKSQPGSVVLDITNHYSFTDLSQLKTSWRLTKESKLLKSGIARLKLAPRSSGKVALPLPEDVLAKADTLRIDFDHPQGWNITYQFQLSKPASKPAMVAKIPESLPIPRLSLVSRITTKDFESWRKEYRTTYGLANIKVNPSETNKLADMHTLDADIISTASSVVPQSPAPTEENIAEANPPKVGEIFGKLHAEFARGLFSYRIEWLGRKADIQQLGWVLDMPAGFDRFSWDRKAPWSYYPHDYIGRAAGTAMPDSANTDVLNLTRPDAFDFNSTKYNCNWASLTDSKGEGLRVAFSSRDRHQVRGGFGPEGGHSLIVNKFCCPPRDISSNCVPDLYLELSPGDAIEGSFKIGLDKVVR